jgi:HAD superfamily hydrolase (TIGR01662 family)
MSSNQGRNAGVLGDLEIPLGLGLLRLTTDGRPDDIDALAVIRFALNQGVRVLDTADCYSLGEADFHYGEHLVRQALKSWKGPKEDVKILTKVGLTRPGGHWVPNGNPEHLKQSVDDSLKALNVERLFLLQLHVRDPRVPFEETLDALAELQQEGKVEHLGLCNVSMGELAQAQRHFVVATVQNELSVLNRKDATDGMLAVTRANGITFLAYRPLGGHAKVSELSQSPILVPLAQRHQSTPHEIALAALLDASDHVVPLFGATRIGSIRSSVNSPSLVLDVSDRTALSFGYSFAATSQVVGLSGSQQNQGVVPGASVASGGLLPNQGPGNTPEVVLLMGIQGAGKSELVASYVEQGYVRLNRDELGGTLDDLIPRLQQLLTVGYQRVVMDNTYPTRASRASAIAAARAYGVPVRCRHLQTPTHEAYANLTLRMLAKYGVPLGPAEMKMFRKADPNLPPPQALAKWLGSFEPPYLDEGFAAVDAIEFERRIDPSYTQKGLLLDVDGTLRRTLSGEYYPRHPDDVQILPRRKETLTRWIEQGYQLFFVSNQGGIAGGHVDHQSVQDAMLRTAELLEVPITEVVYCPHPTKPVGCFCRKPMPGLGVYLIERHRLSREHLVMVGDMQSDAEFAAGLGIQYFDAEAFFCGDGAGNQ